MLYEVFSPFTRCAEIHGAHLNLKDAADCHAQIAEQRDGDMPLYKSSGKYIHVIAAVDEDGNQQAFTDQEIREWKTLALPAEAVLTEKERITTFYNVAKMYHEALQLVLVSSIDLAGIFDYENKDKHFWSTDAGIGQALAYAQQAVFTLEISLKALLEIHGKLVRIPREQRQNWKTHDLIKLFGLLDEEERQRLEQKWMSLSSTHYCPYNTFFNFLTAIRKSYTTWRYIPDLTSTDLSIDINLLSNSSGIVLDIAALSLQENSPFKIEFTSQTNSGMDNADATLIPRETMVEGLVRSVAIPADFDPNAAVEVVIQPELYYNGSSVINPDRDVIARFRKSQVEAYYCIEGEKVALVGYSTDAVPHILESASHRDLFKREPSYTFEYYTLRGSVYNLVRSADMYGRLTKANLILQSSTFLNHIDCLFITDEERAKIADLQLGDEITIRGQVTLLNGRPVVLVDPVMVEQA